MRKNLEASVQIRPSDFQDYSDALDADLVDAQIRLDSEFASLLNRARSQDAPLHYYPSTSQAYEMPHVGEARPSAKHYRPRGRTNYYTVLNEVALSGSVIGEDFLSYDGDDVYRTDELARFQEEGPRYKKISAALGKLSISRIADWFKDYRSRPLLRDTLPVEEPVAPVIELDSRRRKSAAPAGHLIAASVASVVLIAVASGQVAKGYDKLASKFGAKSAGAVQEQVDLNYTSPTTSVHAPHELVVEAPSAGSIDLSAIYSEVKAKHDAAVQAEAEKKRADQEAAQKKAAATTTTMVAAPATSEIVPSVSHVRELARSIASQEYGYDARELSCLDGLWGGKESGYKPGVLNPSSYAAGIPQAWPGTKIYPNLYSMDTYYDDDGQLRLTHPNTEKEIRWGLDYIDERSDYQGSACAALSLHNTRGWY